MNIVIDTNIFISALIKDSKTREIIFKTNLNLLFPEFEFQEIFNHTDEILKKSKLKESELHSVLLGLLRKVKIIRVDKIIKYKKEADKIIGNIDKDDVIFIATALAFNCPIWTDDNHFQKQNRIKIIKTNEMIKFI